MKFWVLILVCFLSFSFAGESQAQCRGGSCRAGFFGTTPVKRVGGWFRSVRPIRGRIFDGDGKPLQRAD